MNPDADKKPPKAESIESCEGEVNFAAKAEKPSGRQKTRQEQDHEEIGTMVFD